MKNFNNYNINFNDLFGTGLTHKEPRSDTGKVDYTMITFMYGQRQNLLRYEHLIPKTYEMRLIYRIPGGTVRVGSGTGRLS